MGPAVLERALLDIAVPIAVLDGADPHLPVVWVNRAFEVTTGYDAAGARQHQRDPIPPGARNPDALLAVREAVRARRDVASTLSLRRADGSVYTCRIQLSPLLAADGTVEHWVAALQDLTDQLSHDAEQAALVEAERRERRSLGLVAQVSDLLMDVDDRTTPLHEIASLLRHALVGWAAFYVNDGGLRQADGVDANRPPSGKGRKHGVAARQVDEGGDRTPGPDAVQLLLDGAKERPVDLPLDGWFPRGSASSWLADHVTAHAVPNLTAASARAAVFPVSGRRRVLGLLVVLPRTGSGLDGLDQSARTVLELTARRVGLVIDNARLYDREHRLAETLQRAMLPQQADVEGLDVWTYYAPNSENVQVGGDWYDVLQISPDVVGVVIGDVVGHDVEAAAAMGQLRSVVRSYAYDITTPGPVLERVDQLVAGMRIPRSAGLVLSTLTRAEGAWRLEYSRAGHLPLLHVRDREVTELMRGGGPLIGFGGGGRSTESLALEPGDVLVYYTDGLIERRDRGLRDGIDALTEVVGGVTARDSAGIGEEILSRLADHPEDDVAVVVVRVPDPRDHLERGRSPRRRRWSLPSEPTSIGRARHAVVRTCHAWDMPNAANAELVVSELVANAVLHGFGHVSLQLYDTGDGLRIEVEDGNPAPPIATDGHPGRVGGFGIKIVERLADWGWRPSARGKLVWAKVRPGDLPPAAVRRPPGS
ncbi:ATP-binding SpoIIE family protein phosphatase [Cellulomonas edaphi]|uniref:SpoIIE family protein phosphatase n=1 Tax=Cellulomonas edaphi TaxID=3053468 RepID=A0ABT7S292_9CELL|nr:SpoIIE family protein phosphatase [Cellulomons edaphi]MDM7829731.1 SpoIIE family protein phosphatase [Cellulomons edaphi]